MHYVYILKSLKDGKLYIGFTSDLKRKFEDHSNGLVGSTKNRRPLELIYYEAYKLESDARRREAGLKKSGSVHNALVKRLAESLGV